MPPQYSTARPSSLFHKRNMVLTMFDLLPHSAFTLAVVPVVALSAVAALYFSLHRRTKLLPPGPSGLPFFGSVFQLTSERPQLQYKELNDRYGADPSLRLVHSFTHFLHFIGDVVHVKALGQPIILVGSWEAANQLFSKRAGIYSNRPAAHFTESSSVPLSPPTYKWIASDLMFKQVGPARDSPNRSVWPAVEGATKNVPCTPE